MNTGPFELPSVIQHGTNQQLSSVRGRLPALDGLRGFAIFAVFLVHYHALFGDYSRAEPISYAASSVGGVLGNCGVDLFFLLSGLLIYQVLLRDRRYLHFLRRRVERIYPTFAAVFALYVGLSFLFPAESKIPPGASASIAYLLENAALLPGIFHVNPLITVSWSLSYEFAFYIVVPLLVHGLSMRTWSQGKRIALLLLLEVVVVGALWPRQTSYLRMTMFLAGMLVYETLTMPRAVALLSSTTEGVTVALNAVMLPVLYVLLRGGDDLQTGLAWSGPAVLILFADFFLLVVHAVGFDGGIRRVCSGAFVSWLGQISYSFYLIHGLVLNSLSHALHAVIVSNDAVMVFWLMLPVGFAAAVAVAWILFTLVERPLSLSSSKPAAQQPAAVATLSAG